MNATIALVLAPKHEAIFCLSGDLGPEYAFPTGTNKLRSPTRPRRPAYVKTRVDYRACGVRNPTCDGPERVS